MIASKLIFQSSCVFLAIGTVVGGSIFYSKTTDSNTIYLIGDVDTTTPIIEHVTAKKPPHKIQYSCLMSNDKDQKLNDTNISDDFCKVFLINSDTSKIKTINLNEITNKQNQIFQTSAITSTTKTLIFEFNKHIYKNFEAGAKNIKLQVKPSASEPKKTIATINKVREFTPNNLIDFKTNLLTVKATNVESSIDINDSTEYLCKFADSKWKYEDCEFKKTAATNAPFTDTTEFTGITSLSSKAVLTKDNFYILKLKTKFSKAKLKKTPIQLFIKSSKTFLADLDCEQLLFGELKTSQNLYLIEPNNEQFLVAVAEEVISPPQSTNELFVDEVKNYKCEMNNTFDTKCELYDIALSENKHSIRSESLISTSTVIKEKAALTSKKYFKLRFDNPSFSTLNLLNEERINLISIVPKQNPQSQKYISLKPLYKIKNNKLIGFSSFLLGKLSETTKITDTNPTTYTCAFNNKEGQSCDIYKFTETKPKETNPTKLKFETSSKTTNPSELNNTDFFVLDLKNQKYDLSKEIHALQITLKAAGTTSDQTTTKTFTFTPSYKLLTKVSPESKLSPTIII